MAMRTCNRCDKQWDDGYDEETGDWLSFAEGGAYCPACESCGHCGCCPCNKPDCDWCMNTGIFAEFAEDDDEYGEE